MCRASVRPARRSPRIRLMFIRYWPVGRGRTPEASAPGCRLMVPPLTAPPSAVVMTRPPAAPAGRVMAYRNVPASPETGARMMFATVVSPRLAVTPALPRAMADQAPSVPVKAVALIVQLPGARAMVWVPPVSSVTGSRASGPLKLRSYLVKGGRTGYTVRAVVL